MPRLNQSRLAPVAALTLWAVVSGCGAAGSTLAVPSTSEPETSAEVEVLGTTQIAPAATTTAPALEPEPLDIAASEPSGGAAPAAASPSPLAATGEPAPGPAEIGSVALRLVPFDFANEFTNWTVEFLDSHAGIRAVTLTYERRIEIYVREDDSVEDVARVFAHELGHVIDLERNDEDDRRRWRMARGASDATPWWPSSWAQDRSTLAGDFAEAVAVVLTGGESGSRAAGPLDDEDVELLRELMAR